MVALVLFLWQVTVTDGSGASRVCGSTFDALVDRTGWESWWSADLADPDQGVRRALLRTTRCPGALNSRSVVVSAFGVAGIGLLLLVWPRRSTIGGSPASRSTLDERMWRLGRASSAAGYILTAAGLVGLVVLVADAESTLFLYTDRLVVGVIGLVVLIPPMALVVLGRGLRIVGAHLASVDETQLRPGAGEQPPAQVTERDVET